MTRQRRDLAVAAQARAVTGGAWKGANIIFDFFLSAPVQLSASIAGLILVGIYVWVRTATR